MGAKREATNGMLDSFSGLAAQLPRGQRTPEKVLEALRRNPRVSTFDMGEHTWLCNCIADLKRSNLITEDKDEPYPWHLFYIQPKEPQ